MSVEVGIRGVSKTFTSHDGERVRALADVDLEIGGGEFFVLVGDSGSGKTTLMRSIAGLERPDAGEIDIEGRTVFSAGRGMFVPARARGIGMVFQSYAIWPHLTVYENLALPLRRGRNRLGRDDVDRRVTEALRMVGLEAFASRPAPNLSGGQQQRVALARAIAVSTGLLIMDEPMSNLDARLRDEVRAEMRAVVGRYGTTVIYVTHDQVEALSVATRIALMRRGRVLQVGTPEDLYDRAASPEVAEFFGPMNFQPGEIAGDGMVQTALGTLSTEAGDAVGRDVLVGIRPQRLVITAGCETGDENSFHAMIVERIFHGGTVVYHLETEGGRMRAETPVEFAVGDRVTVTLPSSALRLFPREA